MPGVPSPTALDLFAGAGGATAGLKDAGFVLVGAVENDKDACASYARNHPDVRLWEADIRSVPASKLRDHLGLEKGDLTLLKACPPCQGFSTLAEGRGGVDESRNDLVTDIIRFIRALRPISVLLENVPGLRRDKRLTRLTDALSRLGYSWRSYIIDAKDVGVPQRRKRLILLAVKGRRQDLPKSLFDLVPPEEVLEPRTAGQAFDALESCLRSGDPLNRYRKSSAAVLERISAVPVNGTRFDLPVELQLRCHQLVDEKKSRSATASYGRIRRDAPAPTMTTRCTTPACGSFIHPTENRGISLREAATLQTFAPTYEFVGDYGSVERQIGNAVPVLLARFLGQAVLAALDLSAA
ncbi:DNA cytosine methyltransferase [Sphaerisporangium sp. NPDC051011]|uniref:DNA cytosine methyltransferase n=1 Tax=Sphaerisporangium sp. NPDC051011 TaxID=3155792 RepID=UPI0033D93FD4